MPKRKSLSTVTQEPSIATASIPPQPLSVDEAAPPPRRRASRRKAPDTGSVNPDKNANVLDAPEALRASPDADEVDERIDLEKAGMDVENQVKSDDESSLSEPPDIEPPIKPTKGGSKSRPSKSARKGIKAEHKEDSTAAVEPEKKAGNVKDPQFLDPEAEGNEEADEEEIQAAVSRPPPVHSDYLPLPWKGRLGYACLCTYLRFSNPPVFSSRTCRIASILENRHPLRDSNEPPHATKNRPDREQPADVARGQAFVESLGKANARDIVKMLRWNHRYGIKFLRLSSEMFPFASHDEYGYKLGFASEELADAGRVAAELGHRLTTHPGQFTQLGSPRKQVIDNAVRDLDYHAELLSLLKLPPQQNRDAVMILHLGGVFGDKAATLDRFRENYAQLPQNVKDRLVLENDDVSWSVHDLLPLCEELNIPLVLDFHHHNIIFDAAQVCEGTKDIVPLIPRIIATWRRKNITPKMHYSEPTPSAITPRQRRKHNPRVATLPPCPPDMDLMIEAKDKEQAVFELMRTFKLPGFDTFNDMIPHVRKDDNKPVRPLTKKKSTPKKKLKSATDEADTEAANEVVEEEQPVIPGGEVGMGGPEGRVYWPPGMEDWLRPVKKVVKSKEKKEGNVEENGTTKATPAKKKAAAAAKAVKEAEKVEEEVKVNGMTNGDVDDGVVSSKSVGKRTGTKAAAAKVKSRGQANGTKKAVGGKKRKGVVRGSISSDENEEEEVDGFDEEEGEAEFEAGEEEPALKRRKKSPMVQKRGGRRASARAKRISYAEEGGEDAG